MPLALTSLADEHPTFRTHGGVRADLEAACARHPDVASFHELGPSDEGAMLYGVRLGTGDHTISLIAGNHADEPVGPETLRAFV
ncbi:MAG: M14 family zinc carboxypeptidase, partial [Salinibacter sp.]